MSTTYTLLKKDGVEIELDEMSNRFSLAVSEGGPENAWASSVALTPDDVIAMALEMIKVASYWTTTDEFNKAVADKIDDEGGANSYLATYVRAVAEVTETRRYCLTCKSRGFAPSRLGPDRCEFCDGTFGGNPPSEDEVAEARKTLIEKMTGFAGRFTGGFTDGGIVPGKGSPTGRLSTGEPNIQNTPGSLADQLDKLHERGIINLSRKDKE